MNEWVIMGEGDIFLLHTDGLAEHNNDGEDYFPRRLEQKIREVKHQSAAEIFHSVTADMLAFGAPVRRHQPRRQAIRYRQPGLAGTEISSVESRWAAGSIAVAPACS